LREIIQAVIDDNMDDEKIKLKILEAIRRE
jgi:hypothetical protein